MARESSYQSIGNPLQLGRLPKRRPDIAMRYLPCTPVEDSRHTLEIVRVAFVIGLAAIAVHYFAVFPQGPFPFLMTNALPAFAAIVIMLRAYHEHDRRLLGLPLACLAAGTLYLNFPLPFAMHQAIASLALARLTWLVADHWTHFCTASPLDRTTANCLHQQWKWYVGGISCIPVLVFVVSRFSTVFAIALGTAVVVVQFGDLVFRGTSLRKFLVMWRALVSWLTYDKLDVSPPGSFSSPAGVWQVRLGMSVLCLVSLSVLPIDTILRQAQLQSSGEPFSIFAELRSLLVTNLLYLPTFAILPTLATIVVPVVLTLPLLAVSERFRRGKVNAENWQQLVDDVQSSDDPVERESIFMGRVAQDATPFIVPRKVYSEHAHFLGDSGGGKTSMGLSPLAEQLGIRGDCSIIVVDLKADSMELFGMLEATARKARERTGRSPAIKHFTNQTDRSTFAFNMLRYPFWKDLDLYMRTDILCGALGLTYGADYGEGYYSSANAAVLHATMQRYPDVETFRELGERVGYITTKAKDVGLPSETKKAGVHVKAVLDRLGTCPALNADPTDGCNDEALKHAIDFTEVFQQPQFHYFHLSSTLAPGASPEIARLVTYSLLAAATQVQRRCQVYLVIDEFQRMVARNIEYMLQLARSMGVGVILANQSMQDLRTSTADLIPAIEANCRYRQWFSVSSADDRKRLIESSGETIETLMTQTITNSETNTSSVSYSEHFRPRLTVNDLLLASDHPRRSIARISRGDGYAQYGGMPVTIESDYHISQQEYDQRKNTPWPTGVTGAFQPQKPDANAPSQKKPPGPVVTTEVIGSGIDPLSQFKPKRSRRKKAEA